MIRNNPNDRFSLQTVAGWLNTAAWCVGALCRFLWEQPGHLLFMQGLLSCLVGYGFSLFMGPFGVFMMWLGRVWFCLMSGTAIAKVLVGILRRAQR